MFHFQLSGKLKGAQGISHQLPCLDLPHPNAWSEENSPAIYAVYDHVTGCARIDAGRCGVCGKMVGEKEKGKNG
jgi:hypothetical protein